MTHYKYIQGSVFLVNDDGSIVYEVTEPAVCVDIQSDTLHKIGNADMCYSFYHKIVETKIPMLYEDLRVIEFKDSFFGGMKKEELATLFDTFLQCSSYCSKWLQEKGIYGSKSAE